MVAKEFFLGKRKQVCSDSNESKYLSSNCEKSLDRNNSNPNNNNVVKIPKHLRFTNQSDELNEEL